MGKEYNTYPVKRYDDDNDVLHIYLSPRCNEWQASAEEPTHDVYVLMDDDTDEIVGFKILNFRKNGDKAQRLYPQYDFSPIKQMEAETA